MNRRTTIALCGLASTLATTLRAHADGPLVYHRIDIASYHTATCDNTQGFEAYAHSVLDSREFAYGTISAGGSGRRGFRFELLSLLFLSAPLDLLQPGQGDQPESAVLAGIDSRSSGFRTNTVSTRNPVVFDSGTGIAAQLPVLGDSGPLYGGEVRAGDKTTVFRLAGFTDTNSGARHAVYWEQVTPEVFSTWNLIELPTLGLMTDDSEAYGKNSQNWIVGWSTNNLDDTRHAVVWSPHPTLPLTWIIDDLPPEGAEGAALDINDSNVIVGWSTNAQNKQIAVRWDFSAQSGWQMTELGLLAGFQESGAHAINNLGDIVGELAQEFDFGNPSQNNGFVIYAKRRTVAPRAATPGRSTRRWTSTTRATLPAAPIAQRQAPRYSDLSCCG